MDNLARKLQGGEVVQQIGTVVREAGRELRVRTESGEYQARRAVSCLVAPAVGDEVLVACRVTGACYVLAVLEREAGAATELTVEGDLRIKVPGGRFAVAAQQGMSLVSADELSLASGRVDVRAVEGSIAVDRLTYWGRLVQSEIEKVKLFAGSLDSVLERWSQKVKRVYRRVEETDQLRAGSVDYVADKAMSLHADNALVTAKKVVKVDGEQILLG